MSHSDPFEDFLSVSAALTGFSVAQLQGTGMARGYFDELVAIVGAELTIALTREGRLALRWPDDVEEQLRLRVMDDPDLGPLARNLVLLWYTGGWVQLPADWRERNGASSLDGDRLLSARSWTEALMWPAIGAHPTGAKAPGFASWTGPPSMGGPA